MFSHVHHDLEGLAADRFRSLAGQLRRLQQQNSSPQRLDAACRDEVAWMETAGGLNGCREKYEACARLLTDLAKLRWRIVVDGFGIELSTPNARRVGASDVGTYKAAIRQELESQVKNQLGSKPVRDFIRKMERPVASGKKRPVLELIADGRELRTRLLASREAVGEERVARCGEAVRPYLQLVEASAIDAFTGHTLSDIWRYFRYTWSIPATNVPGRNLFYLIRDAAHPSHAIMGITALSNAPLSLGDRDRRLGWTAASTTELAAGLAELPEPEASARLGELFEDLEANVQNGLDAISYDQLLKGSEAEAPTPEVIARLKRRAAQFAARRESILGESDLPLTVNELEETEYGDPAVSEEVLALESKVYGNQKMDKARRAMTAKKRAAELARLLQARLVLREYRDRLLSVDGAPGAYGSEAVTGAVNTAWVSAKNARAGTSMLEITVCGAVRPYNHILGGKLAALLMLSPQVADDYTRRYGGAVSIISSMMKNEPVVKDSRLVFLGTTSLYLHGASQYNRVRLPAGTISPEQEEIRYQPVGETGGFGTVQFSAETVAAVEKVMTGTKGYRQVNSVFGEGRSPKLRKLRSGLDALGFDADMLLQHHQRRVIYGVKLYPGADEFLRSGRGEMPDFVKEPGRFRDGTDKISAYWNARWLSRRLDHGPVFDALSKCEAWELGRSIPVEVEGREQRAGSDSRTAPTQTETTVAPPANTATELDTSLWESLAAAGHDSCSDCVGDEDLDRLHVPTPLEDFLIGKVGEGFSVLLTGNAGDGKTHLLRRIASALESSDALVDLDATAVMRRGSVAPILDRWRSALDSGRPYCLAANEYPLYRLVAEGGGVLPGGLHAELVRQSRERLAYAPEIELGEAATEKLLVVDLSLRNPLAEPFSLAALRRMLEDPAIVARATSGDDPDFAWNHRMLSSDRVRGRLGALFQRLADRSHRCTVRELWICLARLLFGDPAEWASGAPSAGSPRSWYSTRLWTLPASGIRFRLGNLLNELADPAASSHPHWDAKLERASDMDASDWTGGVPAVEVSYHDPKVGLARFASLKRRFYFEHRSGDAAFALRRGYGEDFGNLLGGAATADEVFKNRLLRFINHAYCPRPFSGSERDLYLWFSHRFHEQPTRAYVASRSIPSAAFTVRLPRLPGRLRGAFSYRPDHLVLECTVADRKVRLRVDAALHAALAQLGSGFPRHLAPDSELNKLDDFLSRLLRLDVPDTRQFLIYSAESRLATRVTLDEGFGKYLEVEKLAA